MRKNYEIEYMSKKYKETRAELKKAQADVEALSHGRAAGKLETAKKRVERYSLMLKEQTELAELLKFLPKEINQIFQRNLAKNIRRDYMRLKIFQKIMLIDATEPTGKYANLVKWQLDDWKDHPLSKRYPELLDREAMKAISESKDWKDEQKYSSMQYYVSKEMDLGEKYYSSPRNYALHHKEDRIKDQVKMKAALAANIKKHMNKVEFVDVTNMDHMDILGDTGSIRMQIAWAGGWNIQRYHARFLISPIGPKKPKAKEA